MYVCVCVCVYPREGNVTLKTTSNAFLLNKICLNQIVFCITLAIALASTDGAAEATFSLI